MNDEIIIRALRQNNLKSIDIHIPKKKIVVFTGVSGSGKSSIVFDTVAAESARQMNETYPAFVRSRLPKYPKPDCDGIENLSPSVIIDQTPLGSTARSTVGTSSEIYSMLRLLFSRLGQPYVGAASLFSFNDPAGMCPECSGLGSVTDIDLDAIIDWDKTLNGGAIRDTTVQVGSWYWKKFINSGLFNPDKKIKDYSERELDLLLNGRESRDKAEALPGIYTIYRKRYLTRDVSNISQKKGERLLTQKLCPLCRGKRLNRRALGCWINGLSIADFADMELTDLRDELGKITDPSVGGLVDSIGRALTRMIDIGLGYLSLSRPTQTLSGGEAQRVKLVRYLGSSLSDMLYIFDEPSTGMHPRDVYRMNKLLTELRDKGNTVLVVEHDEDVISIADEVIDIGPLAGTDGGRVVFQGSYPELLKADTLTAKAMRERHRIPRSFASPAGFLPIRGASLHNLKGCDADIPLGCICTVTGVAGSGKSSLMQVFAGKYADSVIKIDQKPITATNRSTPASYLGIMDEIRREFAAETGADEGMFSFNSLGGCPHCGGKGVTVTELAFMDPIVTTCEECGGARYSREALALRWRGKNILDVLALTAQEALEFFDSPRITKKLRAMNEVGLSYMTLGQPMSTLSGGERQRIKLAVSLGKRGSIYLLDEPTTGLHPSDTGRLMELFRALVKKGNSVILIEHNTEVMKMSDYIIDIGPDGGKNGGEVVFAGTPREMVERSDTITAKCLRMAESGKSFSPEELMAMTAVRRDEKEEDNMSGFRLDPIGRVESEHGEFKVVLDKKYKDALIGLDGFTHAQIIWWFDGCDNEKDRSVLVNDKPYTNGPDVIGTFATRSPQRPNPIAVSVAEIVSVDTDTATVNLGYIDALTGTPVLDIKPYTPSADRVETAGVPAWCAHWPKSYEQSESFDWEKEFNFR